MPPKTRISEDAIIDAGIEITREKGINYINARELAKSLGCSIQPVFRNFQNMDNLKKILYQKAESIYDNYMKMGMNNHSIPFLGLGMAYIEFAKKEKKLLNSFLCKMSLEVRVYLK